MASREREIQDMTQAYFNQEGPPFYMPSHSYMQKTYDADGDLWQKIEPPQKMFKITNDQHNKIYLP